LQARDMAREGFEGYTVVLRVARPSDAHLRRASLSLLRRQVEGRASALGWGGRVRAEDGVVVIEGGDQVRAAQEASLFSGVREAAVGRKVPPGFEAAVQAIVEAGSKVVYPGERFRVKVETQGTEFSGTDVEYASTSKLIDMLAPKGCRPDERRPDKVISAWASPERTYVSYMAFPGFGGLPAGVNGRVVLLFSGGMGSSEAALGALRAGLEPTLTYLYTESTPPQHMRRALARAATLRAHCPTSSFHLWVADVSELMDVIEEKLPSEYKEWAAFRAMGTVGANFASKLDAGWVSAGFTAEDMGAVRAAAFCREAASRGIATIFPAASRTEREVEEGVRNLPKHLAKGGRWRLVERGSSRRKLKDPTEAERAWSRARLEETAKKASEEAFRVDLGRGYMDYFASMDSLARELKKRSA